MLRYFTKADILLIAGLSLLSLLSISAVRTLYNGGEHLVVEVNGRRVLELSLETDVTEIVHGPLGETIIRIDNGTAQVISSACPHHYCVRMGRIERQGEMVVCVPNRVVLTISGGGEDGLDGVTQ